MDEKQKLDKAHAELVTLLRLWGIDDHLGHRTEQTLRLSATGAENIVALIDALIAEIGRLGIIVGELYKEPTV